VRGVDELILRSSSITFRNNQIEEVCMKTRDLGFNAIEVWRGHIKDVNTIDLLEQFSSVLSKKFGLQISALNNGGEYFEPFGTERDRTLTLQALREAVDVASHLHTRDILLFEGIRPDGRSPSEDMGLLAPLSELFREAVDYASSRSIRLLVEPHPFTLGMNLDFLKQLCDTLDSKYFGVLYDCSHFGVGKPDAYAEAIRTLGNRIKHIHYSDSDMKTSELHYPIGMGRLDLNSVLDAFLDIGYTGTVTLDLYKYPFPVEGSRMSLPGMKSAIDALAIEG
jgi:sugar phosphate isomerase/epimerase